MKTCSCCGRDDDVQIHHLVPKSLGGADDLAIPLCFLCHRKTHGLEPRELNHAELTKRALQAAKARGVKLGWAQESRCSEAHRAAVEKGAAQTAAKADTFAERLRPIVQSFAAGASLRDIARELNERGILTPRGKEWQAASVRNLLARLAAIDERNRN